MSVPAFPRIALLTSGAICQGKWHSDLRLRARATLFNDVLVEASDRAKEAREKPPRFRWPEGSGPKIWRSPGSRPPEDLHSMLALAVDHS